MGPSGSGRTSISTDRDILVSVLENPARFLDDEDPHVRRLAVSACSVDPKGVVELGDLAVRDPDPTVRALAVEALGLAGETADLARTDADDRVREAAATAAGEVGSTAAVDWLIEAARSDEDQLVREAAVAALGAIGDERALPVLLDLVTEGRPRVRRRAVVALTVFDDPAVEPAIRAAAGDRNPGVREAAEMVVGRSSSPPQGGGDAEER